MVTAADKARFALNKGRPRPAYQPKAIRCAHCGAGLTQKDERSELIVCDYCGSRLDVSREEMAVLGQGGGKDVDFAVKVGDSFRYRVCALRGPGPAGLRRRRRHGVDPGIPALQSPPGFHVAG